MLWEIRKDEERFPGAQCPRSDGRVAIRGREGPAQVEGELSLVGDTQKVRGVLGARPQRPEAEPGNLD